mmetsp:Transcript_24072/g.27771  ORF Transcript_24072/g.27771 Transcript_24072/m.27771 type:complete len:94 (-) Transcript_24072:234-515(-)
MKSKIQECGKVLQEKLAIDLSSVLKECKNMVFPPDDVSNYEYELFVLICIMRTNPELFVEKILDKYFEAQSKSNGSKTKMSDITLWEESVSHL